MRRSPSVPWPGADGGWCCPTERAEPTTAEDTGMSNGIKDAAQLRRQAHEQAQRDDFVRALLEERQGYVVRAAAADEAGDGKAAARLLSRVAQVDEQLELRGAGDRIPAAADDETTDETTGQPRRRAAKKAPASGATD